MRMLALAAAAVLMSSSALAQTAPAPTPVADPSDPWIWMEEAESPRALSWVEAENARSLKVLQGDPRYQGLYDEALKIVTATDRVPMPSFRGGHIDNFWQDTTHVRGLWRRTSLDSYRTGRIDWRTVLDVDALAKAEDKNWVYEGADCLPPEERRCLVRLSDGGKDAVTIREFDAETGKFVEGGFHLPEGKQEVSWVDADTLLVAREWTPGEVTESSYAYVVKELKRGQPLDQARELFRGEKKDVAASGWTLRDSDGRVQALMINRAVSFFETENYLLGGPEPVKLPFPLKVSINGLVKGQLVFSINEDWEARGFKSGDVLAYDLAALKRDPASAKPTLVYRPGPRESVEGITFTHDRMVVALYENVKGAAYVYDVNGGAWTRTKLDLPQNASIGLGSVEEKSNRLFVTVTGYLDPTTLWLADAATGKVEKVKQAPSRFDSANLVVEQFEARSKDGTMVPYFVVRRKDVKLDGSNPTLLYAYGGFQASMTPGYSGTVGKLWLERGGVYVVANIRGGGEFGPTWWSAGLKENRQRVYDDFIGVSEDLIRRKITSPRRLGIMGGSNGGLLMGVAMTQRPDLYNAVVVQVPLFDMIRYTGIGAGASWVGEYGDPAIPEQRAYIERYSPYQAIKPGQKYPEPFFVTSTKDDRVHPSHARKASARMTEYGYANLYYENTDGGHAAAANLNETAKRIALEYAYLTRKLMD